MTIRRTNKQHKTVKTNKVDATIPLSQPGRSGSQDKLSDCTPAVGGEFINDRAMTLLKELSKDNPSVSTVLEHTNAMLKCKGYQRMGHSNSRAFFDTHLSEYIWNKPLFLACNQVSCIALKLGFSATINSYASFLMLKKVLPKLRGKVLRYAAKGSDNPIPNPIAIEKVIKEKGLVLKGSSKKAR